MKNALLLSVAGEGQVAIINSKGLTVEEVEAKIGLALEEEYGEIVSAILFDWDGFNSGYKPATMEIAFEEGIRDIEVEETWIY
jgi:hypothetical protein